MAAVLVFALALLAAVLLSERAAHTVLSTAVLFLVAGFAVGRGGLHLIEITAATPAVREASYYALFAILFTEGMRLNRRALARCWHLPGRALLVGMPLSVAATALLARFVAGLDWTESLLMGAVLSPTDPVFAAAIVQRERVPLRLRQLLNVESGLNDGLALPLVVALLARYGGTGSLREELLRLGGGILIGLVVPWVGLKVVDLRVFGAEAEYEPFVGLAVALLVLSIGRLTGANEFLAAFSAGVVTASVRPASAEHFHDLGDQLATLLKFVALLIFGALLSLDYFRTLSPGAWAFALLALLVVRPLTLSIALLGSRLPWREWAVAAWFGPKGFASVVYAVMVLRTGAPDARGFFAIAALVIVASMVAHSSTDVAAAEWLLEDREPSG